MPSANRGLVVAANNGVAKRPTLPAKPDFERPTKKEQKAMMAISLGVKDMAGQWLEVSEK